jgi:hypothetical protein
MTPLPATRERTMLLRRQENMRVTLRRLWRATALGALTTLALFENSAVAADAPPVAAVTPATPGPGTPEWTLSAAAGPVIIALQNPSGGPWQPTFDARSVSWQMELQRRFADRPFLLGGALEGTYDQTGGQQLLGAHVFVGTAWRQRLWSLEATIGVGLEAAQTLQADLTYHLGIYGQGALVAAVPISGALEALLGLGVHLTATHDEDWFAASTIGVRYRLP